MANNKFTLDRFDDFFAVFLPKEDASKPLLVSKNMIKVPLQEGDIVEVEKTETGYKINVLKEETKITRNKVNAFLEKLKNKNK